MSKNKRFIFLLIIGLIVGVTIFVINNEDERSKVCFDNDCFVVEVADTALERETGLMNREKLDRNAGMLFIFDSVGNYPFWMKNTLISLDIIWIDENKEVVFVYEALPCESDPCLIIIPTGNAKYVLEINKGIATEKGITIGKKAQFADNIQ